MAEDKSYGDFEEIVDEGAQPEQQSPEAPVRARMPRKGEYVGIIAQRLGGNRMEVICNDGKKRNCRVPGRFKRSMWLRPKNVVLIKPWPDDDNKADIIFHYKNPGAVNQLRKAGLLDSIKEGF